MPMSMDCSARSRWVSTRPPSSRTSGPSRASKATRTSSLLVVPWVARSSQGSTTALPERLMPLQLLQPLPLLLQAATSRALVELANLLEEPPLLLSPRVTTQGAGLPLLQELPQLLSPAQMASRQLVPPGQGMLPNSPSSSNNWRRSSVGSGRDCLSHLPLQMLMCQLRPQMTVWHLVILSSRRAMDRAMDTSLWTSQPSHSDINSYQGDTA